MEMCGNGVVICTGRIIIKTARPIIQKALLIVLTPMSPGSKNMCNGADHLSAAISIASGIKRAAGVKVKPPVPEII
jgi:hypothetical protein